MLQELLAMLRIPSTGGANIGNPPWTMIPSAAIPPAKLAVSTDANAEIRRLELEITDLQGKMNKQGISGFKQLYSQQITSKQGRIKELRGIDGSTPSPNAAPTFATARIDSPRVGVDSLKIMLPS